MKKERLQYLIKLISENSEEFAFNELMRYYYPGLLSFAHSVVKDRQLCEELIQDIFVKLWENRKTLATINNLSNYLYISVKYSSFATLKKKKPIDYDGFGDSFPASYTNVDTRLISQENLLKVSDAINQLPPKCRLIFRLIKDEGMKYSDVAGILDISVKTVEAQMTIALKQLSEHLRPVLPEYRSIIERKKIKFS